MTSNLSPKKKRFCDFIINFSKKNKRSPIFKEIMNGLNINSLGTINWYVRELEKAGVLKRTKGFNGKRALSIIEENDTNSLPLLGIIAAGYPLESVENHEKIEVPLSYAKPGNYVLRVRGDSMIDDNIQDGDYIIVNKRSNANPGDTVVAIVNEEATLKKYYPKSDKIELHPRNPEYDIINVYPEDRFQINGTILFSFRHYK